MLDSAALCHDGFSTHFCKFGLTGRSSSSSLQGYLQSWDTCVSLCTCAQVSGHLQVQTFPGTSIAMHAGRFWHLLACEMLYVYCPHVGVFDASATRWQGFYCL